jgi:hypothetical protein
MRAARRALAAVILGAVALALAALAAELLLRAAGDAQNDDGFPRGLFANDLSRGYALAPGRHGQVRRVHAFDVEANPAGYRDRPWDTGDARPRILLVGSSALFGVGVPAEARLGERLEARSPRPLRAYNTGIYGYGPPQARATVEKECRPLGADLVLYVHEYKLARWDFLLPDARTVVNGALVNRYDAPGRPRSTEAMAVIAASAQTPVAAPALWSLARLRAWLWRHGWHPTQVVEALRGRDSLPMAYLRRRYVTTADANEFPGDGPQRVAQEVRAMAAAATACGARFAMVLLPGPYEHRYPVDEPASAALLAALERAALPFAVIDLRRSLASRPALVLEGLDYFDAAALDGFAEALLPALAPLLRESGK